MKLHIFIKRIYNKIFFRFIIMCVLLFILFFNNYLNKNNII